jgi:Protein of unknown function (DUF3616)
MQLFSSRYFAQSRRVTLVFIIFAFCIGLYWSQPVTSNGETVQRPTVFNGICDGSAAVRIDGESLLVAYDEENTLFAFDVGGGQPIARVDVGGALGLSSNDEIDIEGAARDGDVIWWIGSHGLDGDGDVAPSRKMLFATNVPSRHLRDFKISEGPIDLTGVLLASAQVARILNGEVRGRKPKEGGVNVEGLAIHSQGGLLLGFRSPLSGSDGLKGKALLVHVAKLGGTYEVKGLHQLELGDRGVRDLVPTQSGYLILAGPVSSGGPYALYDWDGRTNPNEQTSDVLQGFNPEALVRLSDRWLVLSDDGKVKRPDEEAGDGDRKCDKIRKKNTRGEDHPSVHFRGRSF